MQKPFSKSLFRPIFLSHKTPIFETSLFVLLSVTPTGKPPPLAVRLAEALPFRRAAECRREPPCNAPPRSLGRRGSCATGTAQLTAVGTARIPWFVCRRPDAESARGHSDAALGGSAAHAVNTRGAHWVRAMRCLRMGPGASVCPPRTAAPPPSAGAKAKRR